MSNSSPGEAPQSVYLIFDDQTIVENPGFGALGRKPRWESLTDSLDEAEELTLIEIADPQRNLSRTHLAFGFYGEDFWVSDQGSTNGTEIQLIEGERISCTPYERYIIEPDATVFIGDAHFRVGRR